MDFAHGGAAVIIDADLQEPPELIPEMLKKWREGFGVVYGKRIRRAGETAFMKRAASLPEWQISKFSHLANTRDIQH